MEQETAKTTYLSQEEEAIGTVKIADDVVAMIAALAATEGGDLEQEGQGRTGHHHGIRIQYPGDLSARSEQSEERHREHDGTGSDGCQYTDLRDQRCALM